MSKLRTIEDDEARARWGPQGSYKDRYNPIARGGATIYDPKGVSSGLMQRLADAKTLGARISERSTNGIPTMTDEVIQAVRRAELDRNRVGRRRSTSFLGSGLTFNSMSGISSGLGGY